MSNDSIVPENYEELYERYGSFIQSLLMKYNKVTNNYEDLHGSIWKRLLESDIINKYLVKMEEQLPKTMTAVEACEFLGIEFQVWATAMHYYHKGYLLKGIRKFGHYMPTPINMAEFEAEGIEGFTSRRALFDSYDILELSANEKVLKNGNTVGVFRNAGMMIMPKSKASKAHFQSYLAVAVHNAFANCCRTKERREKERLHDSFSVFRAFESNPPSWEETIEDQKSMNQEVLATLSEVKNKLNKVLNDGLKNNSIGKSIKDCEDEMYFLLEKGCTLQQTVSRMGLPSHVQAAMLRAIHPSSVLNT